MIKLIPLLCVLFGLSYAAPSAPPPPPSVGGASGGSESVVPPENSFYNDGVKLLFKKQWAAAEKQFLAVVAINPAMAEGHNNLAYVLRKQGEQNYAKSLEHYNRAIELKPKMAEAYMYRGALHLFMGHSDLAKADYETLKARRSKFAKHLMKIMETGKEEEPEQFYGVNKKK